MLNENKLKQKRTEFLDEQIAYYSVNPKERRNVNKRGVCFYAPLHEKTEGCSIGRNLDIQLAKEIDEIHKGLSNSIYKEAIWEKIPDNLKELDKGFLGRIQVLHDSPYCWNDKGLSIQGKELVENIRKEYC